jgi:putative hydrolase of the HAD superfamily
VTPPKAVFFDAGNTLIFINPAVVLPVFRAFGAEVGEDAFWESEFEARLLLARTVEEGATGTEGHMWQAYFANLFRGCGIREEDLSAVGERVREIHDESHLWTWCAPSTGPALEALKAQGIRLAVISNADGRVEGLIRKAGIRDHFEFVLDSGLEGVEKPDPEIFLRGCRRMGIHPDESLYVGDLYPVDVMGARGAGMTAVLLDPVGRLDYPVDTIPDVAALPAYLTRRSPGP